jgi:hypothetical protein
MKVLSPPFIWPLWRMILRPANPMTPRLPPVFAVLASVLLVLILTVLLYRRAPQVLSVQLVLSPITQILMVEIGLAILAANTGWSALDRRRWLTVSAVAALPSIIFIFVVLSPWSLLALALAALTVGVFALWTGGIAYVMEHGRIVS